MINRYARKEIKEIWTDENKFKIWNQIECHIADKLSDLKIIPKEASQQIRKKIKFNVNEIQKIEKITKHDVVAYIENVSSYLGESSKYFHYGITSSDIIDTGFSIQLKQSAELIIKDIKKVLKEIKIKSIKYKNLIMIGRSHGVHAEPITFGIKLASYYAEFQRNLKRIENAKDEISICSISGPVGTYNSIDPRVEEYVAKKLGLKKETISTQIIPRDRHATFFMTLALIASSIERIAIEFRHLQRTELLEIEESFGKNQKGSSAMPHKRNPILSENLTGLARYIRSSVTPSLENIALWHERDISHSSVERILAPDVSIATDFALDRLSNLIKNIIIYPKNMKKNMNRLNGLHKSQDILLYLIKKGLSRKKAYLIVQKSATETWKKNKSFGEVLSKDPYIKKNINKKELEKLLKAKDRIQNIDYIYKNIFKK